MADAPGPGDAVAPGGDDGFAPLPPPPAWATSSFESASESVFAQTIEVGLATTIFWNSGKLDEVDCKYTGWR